MLLNTNGETHSSYEADMFELFFVCGEGCNEDALLESKAIFQQSCPNSVPSYCLSIDDDPIHPLGWALCQHGPGWQNTSKIMREISVKVLILLYFATATLHIQELQ